MSGHRFGGPKPALPDDTRVLELQWAQAHVGTSLSVSRPTIVRVQLQKELQEFSQAAQTTVLPDATPRKVFSVLSPSGVKVKTGLRLRSRLDYLHKPSRRCSET